MNWNGQEVDAYYKLVDEGEYVLEVNGECLEDVEDYVPDFLSIYDNGYGDYIQMIIHKDGSIDDWSDKQRQEILEYFNEYGDGKNGKYEWNDRP